MGVLNRRLPTDSDLLGGRERHGPAALGSEVVGADLGEELTGELAGGTGDARAERPF